MSQPLRGEQTWIDAAADRFERRWNTGPDRPRIEDFLAGTDPSQRARLLEELVRVECERRRAGGEQPAPECRRDVSGGEEYGSHVSDQGERRKAAE